MRHLRVVAGVAGVALLLGAAATTTGGTALAEAPPVCRSPTCCPKNSRM